MRKVQRALISVSDKTGINEFAKELKAMGVEIISTGGTAKSLAENGVEVTNISDYTGFPEMLDGRVKTLHPKIHAGLLAVRDNPEHIKTIEREKLGLIDMVVVNLYPFKKTIEKKDVTFEDAIENIDIGGPTMIRASAKNFRDVAVIVSPKRYPEIIDELKRNDGVLSYETLFTLAKEVFAHTTEYDALISCYLEGFDRQSESRDALPERVVISGREKQVLRYGENSHQRAVLYDNPSDKGLNLLSADILGGKELSYNNILDVDSVLRLLMEFRKPSCVIVKHNTPCGVALADDLPDAFKDAFDCDTVSAFGGIVGLNGKIDKRTVEMMKGIFFEVVIAPEFDEDALAELKKKKDLRILRLPQIASEEIKGQDIRTVLGGFLLQDRDILTVDNNKIQVVSKRKPTDEEMNGLLFGWTVAKHVKSNAIVFTKGEKTVGIGAGQMSRLDSTRIAIDKSKGRCKGAVMASDAFFPFPDSIQEAGKAGITAVIHPGGSIKDKESVDEAEKFDMAMVTTGGIRHFRH